MIDAHLVYLVMVDDNSNYVRQSERTSGGEFQTLETTIAACRKIVDDDLDHLSKPGMAAEALYNLYTSFGDDPFVIVPPGEPASTSAHGIMANSAPVKCARGARTSSRKSPPAYLQ
jgi:hypothetical protein